jgi:two-component system, cell cycle response regulator DivK
MPAYSSDTVERRHLEANRVLISVIQSVPIGGYTLDSDDESATVLLVEDTEDNRQMMKRLLEMSGFRVVEALNGKQAIEVARQENPEIILMDLSLPFIDGLAATREIRALPGLSDVPIIAVSAHDTADFHSDALEAGCNAYVTKPIDYPELEEVVRRQLSKRSRSAAEQAKR